MFRTPLAVMKHFSASDEQGLVATFRKPEKAIEHGFESTFVVPVVDFRDQEGHDAKTKTLIDFMWSVWCGSFDEEILELCVQDMQQNSGAGAPLWHRYLQDSAQDMGVKYRAFVAACTAGPIPPGPPALPSLGGR